MLHRVALAAVVAFTAAACGDSTSPVASPLDGLAEVSQSDTATYTPPPPPTPGAGSFHGVVRGYQTGIVDTLGTAVLLQGVTVTAYTRVPSAPDEVGAQAGQVFTDSAGFFQMPTLPGGDYVVTFTPAAGSAYQGGWTVTTVTSASNQSAWWIMLPKK